MCGVADWGAVSVKHFGVDGHGVKGGVCLNGDGEGGDRASLGALRLEHSVNIPKTDYKFSII